MDARRRRSALDAVDQLGHRLDDGDPAAIDSLAAGGGTMDDVARVTVYVTDMSGLGQIHEVRGQYFRRPYPASTLVEVKRLVKPEYLIEIDAVAVIPASVSREAAAPEAPAGKGGPAPPPSPRAPSHRP